MNKHVSLAMAGILGVSLVATTSIATVSADTQTLTPKPTSNGTVTFVPNTEGISVLDPNNNKNNFEPSRNSGKINKTDHIDNGLYLPYVPNLDFGNHKVNQIRDKVFFAEAQATAGSIRPNFVQVSDARGKQANPWTLTVSVGAFTNPEDTKDKLDGAQIILRNLQDQDVANSSIKDITTGTTPLLSQQAKLMNDESDNAKASEDEMVTKIDAADPDDSPKSDDSPKIKNSVSIDSKGTHLFTAGTQANASTSIGLYVPKNTQSAVTYNSTMTWTLTTGPTTAGN